MFLLIIFYVIGGNFPIQSDEMNQNQSFTFENSSTFVQRRIIVRTQTKRYPPKFRPPTFPPLEPLQPICQEGEQEQQHSFVFTCIDGFPTATACVAPDGYGQIPLGGQQVIDSFLIKCSNQSGLVSLRFVACVYEGKIYYPGMGNIPFVGEENGNFYGQCTQKPGGILKLVAAGCQDDQGRFLGAGAEFVNSGKKYKCIVKADGEVSAEVLR